MQIFTSTSLHFFLTEHQSQTRTLRFSFLNSVLFSLSLAIGIINSSHHSRFFFRFPSTFRRAENNFFFTFVSDCAIDTISILFSKMTDIDDIFRDKSWWFTLYRLIVMGNTSVLSFMFYRTVVLNFIFIKFRTWLDQDQVLCCTFH